MESPTEPENGQSGTNQAGALIGVTIAERFKILSLLGSGGMSNVYRARHLLLKNDIALKVLHPHLVHSTQSIKRFQQEAAAASSLKHPNIIGVFDFGMDGDRPFMAMDYLAGRSLEEVIKTECSLELDRSLSIFEQICSALSHAHRNNVIHRDLKPSNILLVDQDGKKDVVKVLDFGIAKILPQEGEEHEKLTRTGDVFGSPPYMSPEQCMAQPLDSRSDIYSMGCLMYETLEGCPPFSGGSFMETMYKHMNDSPPGLTSPKMSDAVRAQAESVIFKCLAKEPSDRFQTMDELKNALTEGRMGKETGVFGKLSTFWALRSTKKKAQREKGIKRGLFVAIVLGLIITAGTFAGIYKQRVFDRLAEMRELSSKTYQTNWDVLGRGTPVEKDKLALVRQEDKLKGYLGLIESTQGYDSPKVVKVSKRLAGLYLDQGKYYRAAQQYEKIISRLEPHKDQYQDELAYLNSRAGAAYNMAGMNKRAIKNYEEAVRILNPYPEAQAETQELPSVLAGLSDCYKEENQDDKAFECLLKAREIADRMKGSVGRSYPYPYLSLGELYLKRGDLNAAKENLELAAYFANEQDEFPFDQGKLSLVKVSPLTAKAHSVYGDCLARMGDWKEAAGNYGRAIAGWEKLGRKRYYRAADMARFKFAQAVAALKDLNLAYKEFSRLLDDVIERPEYNVAFKAHVLLKYAELLDGMGRPAEAAKARMSALLLLMSKPDPSEL